MIAMRNDAKSIAVEDTGDKQVIDEAKIASLIAARSPELPVTAQNR